LGDFHLLNVRYWTPHLEQFGVQEIRDREDRRHFQPALDAHAEWL